LPTGRFLAETLLEPLGIAAGQPDTIGNLRFRGRDLAIFAQMFLNKGMYNHSRVLKQETIARYTAAQGPWTKAADIDWMASLFSASSFGYLSHSGPLLWIDPAKQAFIVLATDPSPRSADIVNDAQRKLMESILFETTNFE